MRKTYEKLEISDARHLLHSQMRGLAVLVSIGVLVFAVLLIARRSTIPDPQPATGPRHGELADRIDPNTATVGQLAAIPDLGEVKANVIVDYRQRYVAAHPGQRAFTSPESLLVIKGIGVSTVENMRPYLIFEHQ